MEPSDGSRQIYRERREARRREIVLRSWIFGGLFVAGLVAYFLLLTPSDPDRPVRAQVSEALELSEGARTAVAAFIDEHHAYPRDNAAASLGPPDTISGTYVASVRVDDGWVVVRFGNGAHRRLQGKTLTLIPDVVEGRDVAWGCSAAEIDLQDLPARCR